MSIAVDNLLRKDAQASRSCKVIKPLGAGRYLVEDQMARQFEASAPAGVKYRAGDWLTIDQTLAITGPGKAFASPRVYRVTP